MANRLAQCLNPSLPSGVHQKSLEVYTYIFSMIGVCRQKLVNLLSWLTEACSKKHSPAISMSISLD